MASTVASMASTPCAIRGRLEAPPLGPISARRLLVAMAIALEGVQLPSPAPPAVVARRRRTVVRTSAPRTGPSSSRAELVVSVVQTPSPDVELLPAPTGGVLEDETDGRGQDEGMVAAMAAVVGRAPVPLPIRAAVVALEPPRVSWLAIPPAGPEAISTSTGVATKASTLVLARHLI